METFIKNLFFVYELLILAYILMSWVPQLRETQVGELLKKIVEPYLQPFRKIIPSIGMIDISPIVALLALDLIKVGLLTLLRVGGLI